MLKVKKLNCWEFKKCGREHRGSRVKEFGVCPAASVVKLHGIHDGSNAGRACWMVAGTMCGGAVQGTFANKFNNCSKCDFYEAVKSEESSRFKLAGTLLGILK